MTVNASPTSDLYLYADEDLTPLGKFKQAFNEQLTYSVDFSDWLVTGETITGIAYSVFPVTTPAFVVSGEVLNGNVATFLLSGGLQNTKYQVYLTTTTSNGRIKSDQLFVDIPPYVTLVEPPAVPSLPAPVTLAEVAAQVAVASALVVSETNLAVASAATASAEAGIATTQAGIATTQAGIATTEAGVATTEAGVATTQAGIATTEAAAASADATAAAATLTTIETIFPGLSSNVEGTGIPGIDGAATIYPWMFYGAPTDPVNALQAILRVQRVSSYTNDFAITGASGDGTTTTLTYVGGPVTIGDTIIVSGAVESTLDGPQVVTASATNSVSFANAFASTTGAGGSFYDGRADTVKGIWALTNTSPNGALYEWGITSEMYNATGGALGHGAQNVALNATVSKQYLSGFNYGTDQIGPTWAANFNAQDLTGTVDPIYSCVGLEIDNYWITGAGTDANKQRVVLQLAWGSTTVDSPSTDHIGIGILFGGADLSTMDCAILFEGAGSYVNVIDTTNITVTGNVLNLTNFTVDGTGDLVMYGAAAFGKTGAGAFDVAGQALFGDVVTLAAATTAGASLNIPAGVAPTTPNAGDIWATSLGFYFAGTIFAPNSDATGASLNIPEGAAPTAPNNGDIWATSAGIYVQLNGTTYQFTIV